MEKEVCRKHRMSAESKLMYCAKSKDKVEEFKKISTYVQGAYDEDEAFQNLEKELQKMADKDFDGESNRVYYVSEGICLPTEPLSYDSVHQLAVPPSQFTSLADKLHKNNYKGTTNRLVIEKPFGKDSASAKEMMDAITKDGWKQEEIYRIDHFIGDEMVRIHFNPTNASELTFPGNRRDPSCNCDLPTHSLSTRCSTRTRSLRF